MKLKDGSPSPWLSALFVFCLFGAISFHIQLQGLEFYGVDPYYHIRYAQKLGDFGLEPKMPWASVGIWSHHFANKEFLFHAYLYPFTYLEGASFFGQKVDLIFCGKLANSLLVGLFFSLIFLWLRAHQAELPFLWLFFLFGCSSWWASRLLMVRPHVLSMLFFLAGLYLFERRQLWWLTLVSLLYPIAYHAAFILPGAIFFSALVVWWRRNVFPLKEVFFSAGATLLGYLLHPHFPNNLYIFYIQDILVPFHSLRGKGEIALHLGRELHAYPLGTYLMLSLLLFLLWGIWLWRAKNHTRQLKRLSPEVWALGGLAVMFTLVSFRMPRMAEYGVPLSILFIALSWKVFPPLKAKRWHNQPWLWLVPIGLGYLCYWLIFREPWETLRDWLILLFFFPIPLLFSLRRQPFHIPLASMVFIIAFWCQALFFFRGIGILQTAEQKGLILRPLGSVLPTLPRGSLVYHCCWDLFTHLVYYGPEHKYLFGLDPSFLYYDPKRFRLWKGKKYDLWRSYSLFRQGILPDPYETLRGLFGAQYVMVELLHKDLLEQIQKDGRFQLVFKTDNWHMYQLK